MPSQKKLLSACRNISHHAASGLSFLHPHMYTACCAANIFSIEIDLMQPQPYPANLRPADPLRHALTALHQKAKMILEAEGGFSFEDLSALMLKFVFVHPGDGSICDVHGLLVSKKGKEFRSSVDSIGRAVPTDQSLRVIK